MSETTTNSGPSWEQIAQWIASGVSVVISGVGEIVGYDRETDTYTTSSGQTVPGSAVSGGTVSTSPAGGSSGGVPVTTLLLVLLAVRILQ